MSNSPVWHSAGDGAPRPEAECGAEPRRTPAPTELIKALEAHIGWLKMYAEGATENNWRDMALRASRQAERLSADFDALLSHIAAKDRRLRETTDELRFIGDWASYCLKTRDDDFELASALADIREAARAALKEPTDAE